MTIRARLDRANRLRLLGLDEQADEAVAVLLDSPPTLRQRVTEWLSRAWHRLTCREPRCFFMFGSPQHPRANRRLA